MAKTTKHQAAYSSLMKGLRELDLSGGAVPCDLVLIGDHSFPLAMNSQGQVLMAASFYGHGRIVVLGHESYLTSFPEVVENALAWLRGHGSDVCVGVHRSVKAVADNLSKSSFQAEVVGGFSDKLGAAVYVTDAYSVGADAKELVAFMKKGGGVLIAGQAWHWASQHKKDNTLHQFDGNKVSGVTGIYFSDRKAEKENLPVYPEIPSSWMAVVLGKDFEDDLQFLLQGISEFKFPKNMTASEILVHGPLAFPIGCTDDQETFLAGGYYGQGRVILASHEGLILQEDLAPFWKNALLWLDEGRGGVVGLMGNRGRSVLTKSGLKCERADYKPGLSVFVCTSNVTNHEEILDFVAEGGGLLIGGQAWRWAQTHKKHHVLRDFSGNMVLNKMGLSLLDSTLKGGTFKAPVPSRDLKNIYHFRHHLHRFACHVNKDDHLTKHEQECLKRLGNDCNTYLQMRAHDCPSYLQVVSMLTETLQKSGMPQVSDRCPIKTPKDHLLLNIGTELYNVSPNRDELLPHIIKNNPVLPVVYNHKIKVDVDTSAPEWISTGLYLSPGMKTFVAIPPEMVNKKWKIQIGCHTDRLKSKVLRRPPRVHEVCPVTSEMMQVSNLWGGLLYLVAAKNTKLEGKEVVVQMAVPAPYYKSGETTSEEWALLRTAPAPWAELEFENIILTVPSGSIRNLERPDELADQWDRIMRGVADLSVMPHKFPRKERFVADVQISHGFMHAGYPIMAQRSVASDLVSTQHAKTKGLWGPIHELGHNRQRACCEFPPHTTEATCNLWAVYVHEEVLGVKKDQAHKGVAPAGRHKRAQAYVKGGRQLSNWTMWTALETYLQLQDKFGWDAFKKVFAAYQKMRSHPKIKNVKMNLYAETFSQAVGMDLTGFFKAWGWPIDAATEKKLSKLPSWDDHPMTEFD